MKDEIFHRTLLTTQLTTKKQICGKLFITGQLNFLLKCLRNKKIETIFSFPVNMFILSEIRHYLTIDKKLLIASIKIKDSVERI